MYSTIAVLALLTWLCAQTSESHKGMDLRAFAGFGFGGGLGGGDLSSFRSLHSLPPGPAYLPPMNATTTWGDVVVDVLQLVFDHCKSSRLCNVDEFELFTEYDAKCSDCELCACDEACHVRGDCCLDKLLLNELTDQVVLETAPLETPEWKTVSSCLSSHLTKSVSAASQHHLIITACPASYTGDAATADRCLSSALPSPLAAASTSSPFGFGLSHYDDYDYEGGDGDGVEATATAAPTSPDVLNWTRSFWPLWSQATDRVYGNAECAACHAENPDHLVAWDVKMECEKTIQLSDTPTRDSVITDALNEPSCQISFVPPAGGSSLPCLPELYDYISTCNATGRRSEFDAGLWKACEVFRGHINIGDVTYKNVFCATCNEDQVEAYGKCHERKVFPFFLVVNTSSLPPPKEASAADDEDGRQNNDDDDDDDDQCRCPEGQIFDGYQMECRRLHCGMTRILKQKLFNNNNNHNNNNHNNNNHNNNNNIQGLYKTPPPPQKQQYDCDPFVLNSTGFLYELALKLVPTYDVNGDPLHEPVTIPGSISLHQLALNIRTSFVLQGSTRFGWHVTFQRFRVIVFSYDEETETAWKTDDEAKNINVGKSAVEERKAGRFQDGRPVDTKSRNAEDTAENLRVWSFKVHIRFVSKWPEPTDTLEMRLAAATRSMWNISLGGDGKVSFRAQPVFLAPEERNDNRSFSDANQYALGPERGVKYVVDIPDRHVDLSQIPPNDMYFAVTDVLTCPYVVFNLSTTVKSKEKEIVEDEWLRLDQRSGSVYHVPSGKTIDIRFVQMDLTRRRVRICASQLYDRLVREKLAVPEFRFPVLTILPAPHRKPPESASLLLPDNVLVASHSLSLLCLAVVFNCLLVFLEPSTQDKVALALTLATFLAILLPSVGAGRSDELPESVCVGLGVGSHYCLLATFCWMASAVVNASRELHLSFPPTFAAQRNRSEGFPSFRFILGACVVLPAVMVVATLITNYLITARHGNCQLRLGYGQGICFLSDIWSIWLAAVLPISVATIICMVACARTGWAYSKLHVDRRASLSSDYRRLMLHYLPLSILECACAVSGLAVLVGQSRDVVNSVYLYAALSLLTGFAFFAVFIVLHERKRKQCVARFSALWCSTRTNNFRREEFAPIPNDV